MPSFFSIFDLFSFVWIRQKHSTGRDLPLLQTHTKDRARKEKRESLPLATDHQRASRQFARLASASSQKRLSFRLTSLKVNTILLPNIRKGGECMLIVNRWLDLVLSDGGKKVNLLCVDNVGQKKNRGKSEEQTYFFNFWTRSLPRERKCRLRVCCFQKLPF